MSLVRCVGIVDPLDLVSRKGSVLIISLSHNVEGYTEQNSPVYNKYCMLVVLTLVCILVHEDMNLTWRLRLLLATYP